MSDIHYQHGFKVSPRTKAGIASLAKGIRQELQIRGCCPVDYILEFGWGKFFIETYNVMGENLGLTRPDGTILLREDVYEGACDGNGFHRFTVAHELGHAVMHTHQIGFARMFQKQTDKVYCNSEWQANEFAGCLLVPDFEVSTMDNITTEAIANIYSVSQGCAALRLKKIRGY